jgi:hypothetical protein
MNKDYIYIFHGKNARMCSAVFSSIEEAEKWIKLHNLSGILTKYIIDIPVYKWAVEQNHFQIKQERHKSPEFIQKFTSAYQEHYHYENGIQK